MSLLTVGGGLLAMAVALSGPPPSLPPLPGERPPPPAPTRTPEPSPPPAAPPSVGPPAPGPAPSPAELAPPVSPVVEAAPPPPEDPRAGPPPESVAAPPSGEWSMPEIVEPPQPDPIAPAPEQPADPKSTDAPLMEGEAGVGDGEKPAGVPIALPPPERPPHSGLGLFVTGGVLFALAIVEQSVGQFILQRECVDPIDEMPIQPEDLDEAVFVCTSGVVPAAILQFHAGLNIVGAIALTGAGAGLRAERDAWDDVFATERVRAHAKFRGAGVGVLAGGFVTWLSSSAVTWGLMTRCSSGSCFRKHRIAGFAARDVGFAMMAAGVGLLTYGEIYRRRRGEFVRDRGISVSPTASRNGVGISLGGRF